MTMGKERLHFKVWTRGNQVKHDLRPNFKILPLPRSSGSACTTTALPIMEWTPVRGIYILKVRKRKLSVLDPIKLRSNFINKNINQMKTIQKENQHCRTQAHLNMWLI